jgi:hypothetical protein
MKALCAILREHNKNIAISARWSPSVIKSAN